MHYYFFSLQTSRSASNYLEIVRDILCRRYKCLVFAKKQATSVAAALQAKKRIQLERLRMISLTDLHS